MYRFALDYVKDWKKRASRKPLVMRGARQVGKSHLARMLATQDFGDILEIDLEADPAAASLFASKDPKTILPLLETRYNRAVKAGSTLLFLDEIQAVPELLACLRYFYEKMPTLHVIAAGSLLDFALAEHDISVPVGRIEYLHLGPMSFEEFLIADGQEKLCEFLGNLSVGENVPEAIHGALMRMVRQFLVVGGMPASVEAFVRSHNHRESDLLRQGLLSTYRDDFAKYGKRVDRRRLEMLFEKIPLMAGAKFMYSRVGREERSRDLSRALELLCLARVAHRIRHTAANGIPLGAEADDRNFKVLFMDVGLLCRSCGLSVLDAENAEDVLMINAGAVCEQFIGQHLLYSGEFYEEPRLYCWMRQKKQSSAEVDYVVAVGEHVIPVEVKAGKTGTLKSLQLFLREKRRDFGLRFNADVPSLLRADTSLADGGTKAFQLLSLPLYAVCQARRLCREALSS